MTLDGIKVNHASLDQAAADMQTSVKQIDDRMSRLEAELSPLRSDWAGSAQQQYYVAKKKWDDAIAEMRALLNQTQISVGRSNQDYRSADRRGAQSFEM